MKKYIKPETSIYDACSLEYLLGASVPKGDGYGRWGNGDPNEPFGNESWVNEGYEGDIVMGGDDNGETDSRAKGYSLWDDIDDEEW